MARIRTFVTSQRSTAVSIDTCNAIVRFPGLFWSLTYSRVGVIITSWVWVWVSIHLFHEFVMIFFDSVLIDSSWIDIIRGSYMVQRRTMPRLECKWAYIGCWFEWFFFFTPFNASYPFLTIPSFLSHIFSHFLPPYILSLVPMPSFLTISIWYDKNRHCREGWMQHAHAVGTPSWCEMSVEWDLGWQLDWVGGTGLGSSDRYVPLFLNVSRHNIKVGITVDFSIINDYNSKWHSNFLKTIQVLKRSNSRNRAAEDEKMQRMYGKGCGSSWWIYHWSQIM